MANRHAPSYLRAVARTLYWGYSKETTGEPARLVDLDQAQQKFWVSMARRAVRRIEELDAAGETQA